MPKSPIPNDKIAAILDRVADLLEQKGANRYRIQSYRKAANTISNAKKPIQKVLKEDGLKGLENLRGIGEKLAGSIQEIIETGSLGLLESLQSEITPASVFAKVPGIGKKLGERIHSELGIDTLEELELAAHEGRLGDIEGLGKQKIEGFKNALEGMLSQSSRRRARRKEQGKSESPNQPPVDLILKLDAEYRQKAKDGKLRKIAPKRFNPEGKAWLPIMKVKRKKWSFTLLFSNTKRAHDLGKTDDWVVIYFKQDGDEDQCTVVTATKGPLKGKRVIRGRENECREFYGSE